jgi:2,3,4,5-tetrahydropyridine-2-carboxylate N-succinyltransferase
MELAPMQATFADVMAGRRAAGDAEVEAAIATLSTALETGAVRAAEPDATGVWRTNAWVKEGILVAFRAGRIVDQSPAPQWPFFDKHTLPVRALQLADGVRVVPGGTSIRRGAHVGRGVILMPPAYVNVGAYVGGDTMIDSHALVGSCAQVGSRVHVSAAAQLGGVLEPAGARPVIIEDDVLVGGNCGVYEGTLVRARAVLAAGVVLTASVPVYDLPNERVLRAAPGAGLEIPSGAVVVSGARAAAGAFAAQHGLALYAPVIVKYRDAHTDARTALESALR